LVRDNDGVRMQRIIAVGVACATLGLGLGLSVAVATAATDAPTTSPQPGPARCAAIQEKVAQVPGIQQRITARIDALRRRIDDATNPRRQARRSAVLQPRIDRLEQLSRRLDAQVALAQRLCGRVT
jgi:hypothetical protein